jgi:DNA-binding NarL/FixJ family response regulator
MVRDHSYRRAFSSRFQDVPCRKSQYIAHAQTKSGAVMKHQQGRCFYVDRWPVALNLIQFKIRYNCNYTHQTGFDRIILRHPKIIPRFLKYIVVSEDCVTARVMITDDHPLVREGLAMAMRSAMPGVAIDVAGTIAQAECLARTRTGYRLALLDLVLPDTRGFTGLLRLQFVLPKVPIVMITASREPELVVTAKSLGAAGLIRKDNPLDDVTAALRRVVAGHHVFPEDGVVDVKTMSLQQRIATLSEQADCWRLGRHRGYDQGAYVGDPAQAGRAEPDAGCADDAAAAGGPPAGSRLTTIRDGRRIVRVGQR